MEKKKKKDDSNKYLIPGSIFIIAIFAFVIYLMSHTYALNDVGELSLDCNKTVVAQGDEITCSVTGSVVAGKGVTAIVSKLSLSDNLEFVSFTKASVWQDGSGNKDNIILWRDENITGNFDIGTLVVRVKNATFNAKESIEINNILYTYFISADDMPNYDIPSETVEFDTPTYTSTTYNLSNDYIITDTKNIASIISNISTIGCDVKVSVNNNLVTTGTITSGSKLVIKYNNTTLKEYDLIYLESTKHDLTKNYIFTDKADVTQVLSEFSTTGGTLSIKNGRVTLSYNNTDIKYYDIIQLYTDKFDLNLEENYLLTDNASSVLSDITRSNNVTLNVSGENLQVSYNSEVVKTIKIYYISSSVYSIDLANGYIYIKQAPSSAEEIYSNIQTNATLGAAANTLFIESPTKTIKSLHIIIMEVNNYIVNHDNNYIYTGAVTDTATILNNIIINGNALNETNIEKSISNNKLIIQYNNNKVAEYSILNIASTHNIKDNKIYIEQAESYQTFLSSLTLNGVTAKVFNTNNTQITSGNVDNNYVLKIYTGTTELASYTVSIEYYRVENVDTKTENNVNYIYKLDLSTPYTNLLSNITTSGKVEIKDKNQNTLESTDKIKTGDTVTIKLGSGDVSYKVSVLGDVYADGEVDIRDVNLLYRYYKHPNDYPLAREFILAGEIHADNKIDGADIGLLYYYYRDKLAGKTASLK